MNDSSRFNVGKQDVGQTVITKTTEIGNEDVGHDEAELKRQAERNPKQQQEKEQEKEQEKQKQKQQQQQQGKIPAVKSLKFKKRQRPNGLKTRNKSSRNSFNLPQNPNPNPNVNLKNDEQHTKSERNDSDDEQMTGTVSSETQARRKGQRQQINAGGNNRIRERYTVNEKDDERINEATLSCKETRTEKDEENNIGEQGQRQGRGQDDETQINKKPKSYQYGPVKAPSYLRRSVRMDYQPDVCKDYKETGYCGFGDSCKFLHDRSDYKAGWQLDQTWSDRQTKQKFNEFYNVEQQQQDRDENDEDGKEQIDSSDGLPFACFICRSDFVDPVVTLCNHYFCEACAIEHMAKKKTCAICGKQLRDTLNIAHNLISKLQQKRPTTNDTD